MDKRNILFFGKYLISFISTSPSEQQADTNCKSFFVPRGFAHGILGLDKENIILYTCTKYRDKANEVSIIWNDKDLNIKWGIKNPILSAKDKKAQKITQFIKNFNEKKR